MQIETNISTRCCRCMQHCEWEAVCHRVSRLIVGISTRMSSTPLPPARSPSRGPASKSAGSESTDRASSQRRVRFTPAEGPFYAALSPDVSVPVPAGTGSGRPLDVIAIIAPDAALSKQKAAGGEPARHATPGRHRPTTPTSAARRGGSEASHSPKNEHMFLKVTKVSVHAPVSSPACAWFHLCSPRALPGLGGNPHQLRGFGVIPLQSRVSSKL